MPNRSICRPLPHRPLHPLTATSLLPTQSGLKPSQLGCKQKSYAHAVGSARLAEVGWVYNSVENVVSPCGLVANSAFNDSCAASLAAPPAPRPSDT